MRRAKILPAAAILLISLSLYASKAAQSQAGNTPSSGQPAPPPNAGAPVVSAPAPVASSAPVISDPAAQNRVKSLIALIESKPTGLIVNNTGRVETPPGHQPYTADGSRNQNFKVVPDYENSQAATVVNMDQRRAQAVSELIAIGKPAVDELARALVTEAYEHRNFYAYALGEIKDPRAVPALLKYMEDGKMKLSMVNSVRSSGNAQMAANLEKQGNQMVSDASIALQKITGETYGPDLVKWQTWWNANKQKVGPTPNLIIFTANPPPPAVHYDPNLLKTPPPQN